MSLCHQFYKLCYVKYFNCDSKDSSINNQWTKKRYRFLWSQLSYQLGFHCFLILVFCNFTKLVGSCLIVMFKKIIIFIFSIIDLFSLKQWLECEELSFYGQFFTSQVCCSMRMVKSPRLLMMGQRKATSLVTAALLHKMESCPVFTLDLSTIYSESSRSPEEATVQVSVQPLLSVRLIFQMDRSLYIK